jgi:preprotein translocase subunit SecY
MKIKKSKKRFESSNLLGQKLLFTLLIIAIYLTGRIIPVFGVDVASHASKGAGTQNLLLQSIGGDAYRTSIFALGISPYMLAGLFVMFYSVIKNMDKNNKVSPRFTSRITVALVFVITVFQAVQRSMEFKFLDSTNDQFLFIITSIIELITGAMIILWLAERNKKYGIGGQTALIFINIVDGIVRVFMMYDINKLIIPILLSAAVVAITAYMEYTEKRIPLQRISIHNIHADKNYLAIKHNPVGVMPIMFSSALYMVPVSIIGMLSRTYRNNSEIQWLSVNLGLYKLPGIVLYLVAFMFLTIFFSFIMINPKDISEQFLKSGDGIVGIRAGKETTQFLIKEVLKSSLISGLIMGMCLALSLSLQIFIKIDSGLAMLPSSFMMLTGIWSNLQQEMQAVRNYDSYREFL